jgi:hypothetical protein
MSRAYRMTRIRTGATVEVSEAAIHRTLLQLASEASRDPITGEPTVTERDTRRAMAWSAQLLGGRSVEWVYRGDRVRIDPPPRPLSDIVDETIAQLIAPPR